MKKKLQLRTVLDLKADLEENIIGTEKEIVKYNSHKKIKTNSLFETLETMGEQLIIFKQVQQTANKSKHKDGKTNNYYIYRLYNLKRNRLLYNKINCNDKNSQLSIEEVNNAIRNIEREEGQIQDKLTTFNRNKTVSVELDESLNLWKDE